MIPMENDDYVTIDSLTPRYVIYIHGTVDQPEERRIVYYRNGTVRYTKFMTDPTDWRGGWVDHNDYGPATIYDTGAKAWCIDGLLHRLDGPAMQCYTNDHKYFVNGVQYSEIEYNFWFPQ